ncbi:BspA family leucine-rich repeat surface protein (plasmid) [Campylobacter jejuni]|nr:BspA family leucine-rich repeat surface protein [Campylobacter jejuni]QDQ36544.1 BspA family leucine-rich repeat surface protein [Campylobacter jejuni]
MAKYFPETKEELKALVDNEAIHLGDIDTSKITDMSYLFFYSQRTDFSGIEKWDVSKVENMAHMFAGCKTFNQDLSSWDVNRVENMCAMFKDCKSFNQDISKWDVSNVKDMDSMFWGCYAFNQDISGWDVSKVENMAYMFSGCRNFNQDISSWDVSSVENMDSMFADCKNFNQPLNDWDVSRVENMHHMFEDCYAFNQDLSSWDVSKVENMKGMFWGCESFNQPLGDWDVSNVEYTYNMFENCPIDNSNKPKNLRWQGRDKIFKKRDVLIENNNKSVKSFGHLLREVYEQHFYFILTIIFILGFFININSLDILKIRQYDFAFIVIPMFISVAIEFRFIIEKLNRGLFLLGFLSCIIDAISQGNEIFRLIGISLLTINIIKIIMTNKHKIFP